MTPTIHLSDQCLIDTTRQVSLITGSKDGYATGVFGYAFVMRINNEEVQTATQLLASTSSGAADGFITSEDRSRKLARDGRRSSAIERARQRMGAWLASEQADGAGLVALRLKAGLSQTELAKRLDMLQPNLSRLERGLVDPKLSTLQQLADVLGVDLGTVAAALMSQRASEAV
jgi:ribosome-binding protein aMBF1 (putative translation factor)